MTVLREVATPLTVDSFDVADNVRQVIALDAARIAARARAAGELSDGRITLPYEGGWIRIMAAVLPGVGIVGYKEFHLSPGNVVRYAIHLFRLSDGSPLGVVDAALTTPLRTAAGAAVAAENFFGLKASVRLGIIGSSSEAIAGARALAEVLSVEHVCVTSRSTANREKFATKVSEELGIEVSTASSAAAAAQGRDLVYVATNSGGRVVASLRDLRDVPFVASIGSTIPQQRELDGDVLAGADAVIVDTMEVLEESGDAIAAAAVGLDRSRVLLTGDMPSRQWDRSGLTVYKSIGSPEQDVVLGYAILQAAANEGFGRVVRPLSAIKQNL